VREADLLLVLGARLGEMTTGGYSLFSIPNPKQTMIHAYPGSDELGRVYRPDVAINASMPSLVGKLAALPARNDIAWRERTRQARTEYEAWTEPEETPGAVKLEQVVCHLRDTLPADAVITNGAGNYAGWVNRYYRYRAYRSLLGPTSGSMGYGLPAAVAAKLAAPERAVVCFAGDGCFQMTCQEFGTAVQHGAAIVVIIANNGSYGTIRMHQEREYPGRVSGTRLVNPDFAAFARAYGGHGETVERTEDFAAAFERAQASGKPAIIDLKTDPEALAPRLTLSALAKRK
jgi:acetolactate synthase-1/2/3 large subunit